MTTRRFTRTVASSTDNNDSPEAGSPPGKKGKPMLRSSLIALGATLTLYSCSGNVAVVQPDQSAINQGIENFEYSRYSPYPGAIHSVAYAGAGEVLIRSESHPYDPLQPQTTRRHLTGEEIAFINTFFTDDYLGSCDSIRKPGENEPTVMDGATTTLNIVTTNNAYHWSAYSSDHIPDTIDSLFRFFSGMY